MRDRSASRSDRIYAALLRLFPGDFRGEFAHEMEVDFRDQRVHAERTGGRAAVAILWIHTFFDILRRAPIEQLDVTMRDARYALRLMRRNKLFSATAILTLALAIGINTTIFSIVDGMLFKPLPYHEPHRLVMLTGVRIAGDMPFSLVPKPLTVALRDHHKGLVDVAMVKYGEPLTLRSETDAAASFHAISATANLLDVLGVRPIQGRSPNANDVVNSTAAEQTGLLTYGAWTTRFGGDTLVINRVIHFEERRVRIIGVLPRNFVVPMLASINADLILAAESPFVGPADLGELTQVPIARLKPTVSLAGAQDEMANLSANLVNQYPDLKKFKQQFQLMDLQVGLFESRRSVLWTLFTGAGFVLLIACVNLANLLLSRGDSRDREFAVRTSLGASRLRLIRQLAIESAILALAGGIAGMLLAWWSFDLVVKNVPPVFMLLLPDTLDGRAVAFSALAVGVSIVVFGALPALRGSQSDVITGLQQRRYFSAIRRVGQGRALIAAEAAIVTTLVIAGVLMVGSFGHLRNRVLGFEPDHILSIELATQPIQSARMRNILLQLTNELRHLPGVVSVAAHDTNPIGQLGWGESARLRAGERMVAAQPVTSDYFDVMNIRLVAGRLPTNAEWQPGNALALITERAARVLGGAEASIGHVVELSRRGHATVIGVVGDIRWRYDDVLPRQVVFVPPPSDRWATPGLIARTSGDAINTQHQIRAILARVMPRAVPEILPAPAQLDATLALPRFQAQLLGSFALLALAIAIVGIYGVLAQTVAGRTREIGIRMALGASSLSVRRLVITEGIAPVIVGLTLGIVAGFWTVQVFRRYVHGVQLRDPLFFIVAAAIVIAAALAATWIPARRATRIDPATILKTD